MSASFKDPILIDHDGRIVPDQKQPLGPPFLQPGEKVLRLEAWVFQDDGFCTASAPGPLTGTEWILHPTDYFGNKFKPGSVDGMGLMVTEKENGDKVVEQWSEGKLTLKLATG